MTRSRILRERKAFTLVEVLAALTFTALILPVAMKGVSLATSAAADARRRSEATFLANTLISELAAEGVSQLSETSGDFAPDAPDYRWTAQVLDWQESNLKELQVEVTWQARGSDRSIFLTTLVYETGT